MGKLFAPLRAFLQGVLVLVRLCMVRLAPKSRQPDRTTQSGNDGESSRPGDYA